MNGWMNCCSFIKYAKFSIIKLVCDTIFMSDAIKMKFQSQCDVNSNSPLQYTIIMCKIKLFLQLFLCS